MTAVLQSHECVTAVLQSHECVAAVLQSHECVTAVLRVLSVLLQGPGTSAVACTLTVTRRCGMTSPGDTLYEDINK